MQKKKRKKYSKFFFVFLAAPLFIFFAAYAADNDARQKSNPKYKHSLKTQTYSIQNDIAFVSVWGSRPDAKKLQGFQRAVLFNARGEVVEKVDVSRDSIFSLDRMIQENRSRGPLFIRMYRK